MGRNSAVIWPLGSFQGPGGAAAGREAPGKAGTGGKASGSRFWLSKKWLAPLFRGFHSSLAPTARQGSYAGKPLLRKAFCGFAVHAAKSDQSLRGLRPPNPRGFFDKLGAARRAAPLAAKRRRPPGPLGSSTGQTIHPPTFPTSTSYKQNEPAAPDERRASIIRCKPRKVFQQVFPRFFQKRARGCGGRVAPHTTTLANCGRGAGSPPHGGATERKPS